MIKEVIMFTVVCDNCGKDVNDGEEYSCWSDKNFVQDIATEAGWLHEDDEHYCPDCFSYDDEGNATKSLCDCGKPTDGRYDPCCSLKCWDKKFLE